MRGGNGWIKGFPASSLGQSWFREIRGPFRQVRCVATGGINADTASPFLAAGARLVGVSWALTDPAQLGQIAALVKQ